MNNMQEHITITVTMHIKTFIHYIYIENMHVDALEGFYENYMYT